MAISPVSLSQANTAISLQAEMDQRQGQPPDVIAASLEALDLLDIGVGVTDRMRRLLFANRRAQRILATRDGLGVTAQGVLCTVKTCCGPPLSVVLQQAAQGAMSGKPYSKDAVLAVRRPSGKRPLTLLVRSVQGAASQRTPDGPAVLVFILDPELPVQASAAGLRQLYGLTACEARLAQLLMSGKTLGECCGHLDIRLSTGRVHLRNLFAKTGVRRQGQLISLLLKSVGVVRATGTDRNASPAGQRADPNQLDRRDKDPMFRAPGILAAALEALDLLDIGVGVTDSRRRLLFANQTAQQILATRDGLGLTAQGMLDTVKTRCRSLLTPLVEEGAQAKLRATLPPGDAVLAVQRPSGKRPLTLLVRSLHGKVPQPDPARPAVLVFLLDPDLPVQGTEFELHQLYGFTSSEARLARLLMEGNAFEECCKQLNIRASTARMHLANMFDKAGVQRQGQLVCVLLKSVGIVRVKSDESVFRYAAS
jgi:DNA-binding CsgD family transcriptional regulator